MPSAESLPSADEQLDAIAHLDRILTAEGLPYWLFGGWAVDFWAGRVTRVHDDLGDSRRELRGVTPRTIPPEVLRAGKSSPREGEVEAEKDRADLEALPPA